MKNIIRKLRFFLDKKNKITFIFLIFLIGLSILLEITGIALIFPLLNIVLINNKQNTIQNEFFSSFLEMIPEAFLTIPVILFFYFFRFLFLVFTNFQKNYFANNFSTTISQKLFKSYLGANYEALTKRDVSTINKNLFAETYSTNLFILSFLNLVIDFFIVITVIFSLLNIQFIITSSIILIVSIIGFIYFLITKKYFSSLGKKMESINSSLFKYLTETFNSIKDIIIYKYENNLFERYSTITDLKSNYTTYQQTIGQSTRYFLEFLTLVIIGIMVYLLMILEYNTSDIITLTGIYGFGIIRIIPSLNSILTALNNLKFTSHSVNLIFNEINIEQRKKYSSQIKFKNKIIFQNVYFEYNNNRIFQNFNLEIKKNEYIGIVGESGSGKSTFLDLLCGLKTVSKGDILIDGVKLDKNNFNSWLDYISYVGQNPLIIDMDIKNNLVFGRDNIIESELNKLTNKFKLKFENKNLGEGGANVSGGQKQRISIARALLGNKDIILFDEPTSAQDKLNREIIFEMIEGFKGKKTILVISHDESDLKLCDRIIKLEYE